VSKPNIARKVPQKAPISLKLYTLIFVNQLILHPALEKNIFTFIDDFSRYGYVYLLHEKSQSINALEVFVNECPGPFTKFLESHDVCAQYTMSGTPQQNDVAERRNKTLMEMVRSMISKSSLPKSLWIYARRTAVYLLNKVPKLDSRTVSGYFTGYPQKSKGYKFYYPNHSSKIVEMDNAKFLENGEVSGSVENQEQYLNNEQTPHEENNLPTQTSEPVGITLNKPARVRKSVIPDDYIVYLQETDFDIGIDNDHVSFLQAIKGDKSEMWIDAMKEELK
ncbi:retrovirus-related pol polyprotein from transposon TNT 1-94, partial [Tanacetum coccineum]